MRILYITPYPPLRSGIADYASVFKKALEANKVQMDILPLKKQEHAFCAKPNYFFEIRNEVLKWKNKNNFGYDLVHAELGFSTQREFYYTFFIKRYFPDIPVVITVHDPPLVTNYPMLFIGLQRMPRILRSVRRFLDITIGKIWEQNFLNKIEKIFILSKIGKEKIIKRFYLPEEKITVIPLISWKSLNELKQETVKFESDNINILYLGLVGSTKGVDVLIRAYLELLKDFPVYKKNTQLWLSGDISQLEEYIEKDKIEDSVIKNNFFFLKFVPDKELVNIFKNTGIIVFPHLRSNLYSLSGVLIRGMEVGLPIVASNAKAFPDEVKDYVTGLLFEAGNTTDLKEKLKKLIDNPELREKLGRNAKEHVIKEHSSDEVSKIVISEYKKLV